jgi:hypothetical protein
VARLEPANIFLPFSSTVLAFVHEVAAVPGEEAVDGDDVADPDCIRDQPSRMSKLVALLWKVLDEPLRRTNGAPAATAAMYHSGWPSKKETNDAIRCELAEQKWRHRRT